MVAHVGIIGHDGVLVSLAAPHFINGIIKKNQKLSINIVDEKILPQADYCGSVSGEKEDKSELFAYEKGNAGTPIIKKAPLTMECSVVDIYNTTNFESFICKIEGTYVEEEHLNSEGKINYNTLKPILFEFPTYEYLKTVKEYRGKYIIPKCSKELTAARKEEIIAAYAELYKTMSFKQITIKEIGNVTSFTRTSIYNYFQTKEEIFLKLLKMEYEYCTESLKDIYEKNEKMSRIQHASAFAHSLEKRKNMLKLLSMNLYDIEENSCMERFVDFKENYGKSIAEVRNCLNKLCNDMSIG